MTRLTPFPPLQSVLNSRPLVLSPPRPLLSPRRTSVAPSAPVRSQLWTSSPRSHRLITRRPLVSLMLIPDPTSKGYMAAQYHSADQHDSIYSPPAGRLVRSPNQPVSSSCFLEFSFADPPAGHPDVSAPDLSMINYSVCQPGGYLQSHARSSFVNRTASANPPQIPPPIFHPGNASATNTLDSNIQGDMGSTLLQLPPPTTLNQASLLTPFTSR